MATDIAASVSRAATPYGDIFYYGFDDPIGTSLQRYGSWAPSEVRLLEQFIRPGDTVVDGGANVGMHSLAFARACGMAGRVVAVEASPDIVPLLRRTLEANRLDNVSVVAAALGAAQGHASFGRLVGCGPQNVGMLRIVGEDVDEAERVQVPVTTLDSLDLDAVRLIKLDVEGQELAALRGAADLIKAHHPLIVVEVLSLESAVPVFDHLTALGYSAYFCSFAMFDPENMHGEQENCFGVAREASLLYVHGDIVPAASRGTILTAVRDIDEIARLLTEMPRYGDLTDHDRNAPALVSERQALQRTIDLMRSDREAGLAAQLQGVRDTVAPLNDRIAQLEALVGSLVRDLEQERARTGDLAGDLETMRARTDRHDARIETLASDMIVPEELGRAALAQSTAVKIEVASLREALLGRSDDRTALTLDIEAMRKEHRHLIERSDHQAAEVRDVQDRIGEILDRIEAAGREVDDQAGRAKDIAERVDAIEQLTQKPVRRSLFGG